MDVTFTNVLEGARQYFQGLPTGSNSAVSPAYSSESHLRHDYDRSMPPSSNAYWSPHPTDAAQPSRDQTSGQREHTPVQREHSVLREHASMHKDHAVIHRPASHGSDSSSRPPSHLSQYTQNVPVPVEQNRAYYPGSYQEHYQLSQIQQHQQIKPLQQSQQTQQTQQPQQHQPQPQQHPHPQQPAEHYQQSRQSFEFSRPQTRETPNYSQYQSHIPAAGSPYQQSPSPYHQVPSPQQPRAPSREQMVPRVPSREQTIPRVPSHEQLVPRGSTREQQYSQPNEAYSYTQTFPYYQQPQPKVATSNISYKSSSQQQYPPASQQQQQNMYYKHIYAPQQSHQSVFAASRQDDQSSQPTIRNNAIDQTIRTTHNLPPIAAISNYHSSRVREPPRASVTTTANRTRTYSSSSYTPGQNIPVTSSIIQPNPAASIQNYPNYRTNTSQQYQPTTTVTTQSYTQVIMTNSNTSTSYYNTNQNQSSGQQFQHSGIPTRTHSNELPQTNSVDNTNGRIIVKRESPLDLSVKTVRTPADSTLGDAEQDARNKYLQNHRSSQSLSAHNYPQLDVNSFQRNLTQRSTQLTAATAPKVEFRPNFNVPTLCQPRRPLEEPRRSVILPEKAHSNNKLMPENKNAIYRYPTASVPTAAHVNSYIRAAPKALPCTTPALPTPRFSANDHLKKRTAEVIVPPTIPNKVPKLSTDTWRQSIDLQIEERLSNYKQQQAKLSSPTKVHLVNGTYQEKSKNIYPGYEKPNYESVPQHSSYNQYQSPTNHTQTYVPSPGTHQYPGYNPTQASNSYLQATSRSNSSPSINSLAHSKNTVGGAVDKRVLSLLRNSLEVKGQKKLEQLKSNENFALRSDVQHPSTDVTAPLQPKPAFVSRNNVSPFTPTSFPDNSNMASMYKFHIPKAVDSVNFETNKTNQLHDKQTQDTVITNHTSISPECDGLAAFLAARIRTKGELKQGGPSAQNVNNSKSQLHEVIENQLKSPIKQETPQSSAYSTSSMSSSPPKLQKESPTCASAPRKRLFSRNEEDLLNSVAPPREAGLRSSSETSVFDFPDSDSENDINKETLEAMRKCRKSTKQITLVVDVKLDSSQRVPTPDDEAFSQICDNFLEQLKSGLGKRKFNKKKKGIEPEALSQLQTVTKENPLASAVTVKIEKLDCEEKEDEKTNEILVKPKEEPQEELLEELQIPILEPQVDLTKVKDEPISVDADFKEEELFMTKRKNVRRRILSSSDSSDNETDVNDNKDQHKTEDIKSDKETKTNADIKPEAEIKIEKVVDETKPELVIKENNDTDKKESPSPQKTNEVVPVTRPSKKPSFGDGSDFYPGWEEGVYKYKKSLRMPPTLIQVNRPPVFHRLSTSLPDLDPCPHSPTTSVSCDDKDLKSNKEKRIKSEPPDSDTESNSGFNIFAKKTNYDSEGSCSIKSLPNTGKETSILDRLLEKCGGRKRKKYKRKDDHSPKTVPKSESSVELLGTPSLEIKEEDDKNTKKLSNSPVIKAESPLLGFRKSTISNFKDAFIKRSNNILNNQFTTVVLKSRTRRETRVQKQRATIKEVFGEDRPASAPPVTCLNDIQIKQEIPEENSCLGNLVVRLEKKDEIIEMVSDMKKELNMRKEAEADDSDNKEKEELSKVKKKVDNLLKTIIKTEIEEDSIIEDDTRSLDDVTIKSETPSIDGDDGSISGKKRGKFGKMRRKLSSGFDYIRKKKKVKKENIESDSAEKKKRKSIVSKTLESVDDIQKEIKTWVLNKGIGETHLHRAARLGYTDVTAYCLEKMECNPSPRDNAGYTPLHWACSKGHLQIAKLLLLYGANPSESAQGGIRPLHEAVENGFVEIARLLLSYGADPTLATYSGLTPLALTNDEVTKDFLMNHLNDIEGEAGSHWSSQGPAAIFDPVDHIGFNVLEDVPAPDPESEEEDIDFEMSESLLPNLYTLNNEPPTDRWVLLQDLSTILKIKSRDALLKQICPPSTSSVTSNYKSVIRELRMPEFLEQARCCQFLNGGEKINTRATKIALVKYTEKVRELLNIESISIKAR